MCVLCLECGEEDGGVDTKTPKTGSLTSSYFQLTQENQTYLTESISFVQSFSKHPLVIGAESDIVSGAGRKNDDVGHGTVRSCCTWWTQG